jgi:hypothetical protein
LIDDEVNDDELSNIYDEVVEKSKEPETKKSRTIDPELVKLVLNNSTPGSIFNFNL